METDIEIGPLRKHCQKQNDTVFISHLYDETVLIEHGYSGYVFWREICWLARGVSRYKPGKSYTE